MAVRHRGNGTGAAGAAATSSAGAADGDHSWIALHIVESLYALLILAWIVLAFVGLPVACFDPLRIASDLAGVPAGLAGVPAGLAGVPAGLAGFGEIPMLPFGVRTLRMRFPGSRALPR